MSIKTKALIAAVICISVSILAIGTAFAYTSTTTNSDNSTDNLYLIVTPGDSQYSDNFEKYFEYHWGTTVTENGVSRIYSPCSWNIETIEVEGQDKQAYILGEMKLDIKSIAELDDFKVRMGIPEGQEVLISENYEYAVVASVIKKSDISSKTPYSYGESVKKFSHDVEKSGIYYRYYESEFIISTTAGENKDIILNNLPEDYDKTEYVVTMKLYLLAKTLDFQPESILGTMEGSIQRGIDFTFEAVVLDGSSWI